MKQQKREKVKKLRVWLLNNEYCAWVVWGNKDKVKKWLKNWYDNDPTIDYEAFNKNRGVCYNHHEYNPVIVLNISKYTKESDLIATVAHEAVHAVNDTFNAIGEFDNRGEFFAHSVAAIVRKFCEYRDK